MSALPDHHDDTDSRTRLHASCVALAGQGVLILGASGSGKSALALELMALGATLVSDDQVVMTRRGDALIATAPDSIRGRIEARHIGILRAETVPEVVLRLAVQRDVAENHRLPPHRSMNLLGVAVPLLHNVAQPYFAAAILQYLKTGRASPISGPNT